MKILIFNTLYAPNLLGGAERSVQQLAEALVSKNYEVTVCSTSDINRYSVLKGVRLRFCKVPNLFWGFKIKSKKSIIKLLWHVIDAYNIFSFASLIKIIKEEKPDVIHTNNLAGFSVSVWVIAKSMNIPIVHTLRDYYLTCPRSTRFNKGRICVNSCATCKTLSISKKIVSKKVDAVVGISKSVLNTHTKLSYFKNSSHHVIPNSVKTQVRIDTQCSNQVVKTFGFLGRISKEKGLEILLEAFLKILSPEIKLQIGGEGERGYEQELKETYVSNNINFLGTVKPDVFFEEIDCLIVPSQWEEPFGRVVIEAMMYNIPVIVSNRGGLPEIIHGKNIGQVFKSDSSADLLSCINKYISNNELFLTHSNNIKNELSIYNENSIVEQYVKIYNVIKK